MEINCLAVSCNPAHKAHLLGKLHILRPPAAVAGLLVIKRGNETDRQASYTTGKISFISPRPQFPSGRHPESLYPYTSAGSQA